MAKSRSNTAAGFDSFSQSAEKTTSSLSNGESATPSKAPKKVPQKKKALRATGMTTSLSILENIIDSANDKSWTEFYRIYSPFIKNIGLRYGLDEQSADDLVITVMLEVNKSIGRYDSKKGMFRAWLKTIAMRKAISRIRVILKRISSRPVKPNQDGEEPLTQDIDNIPESQNGLEAEWDAEEAKAIRKLSIQIAKDKVSSRQWQMFESRILRKWPVERVSKTLGVAENTVYGAVHKIRPVYKAAVIEAEARLDRGPLSPLDKKALEGTLALPSYLKSKI